MVLELQYTSTPSKRQQSTPTSVPGIFEAGLLQLPLLESWLSHGLMGPFYIYLLYVSLIHRSLDLQQLAADAAPEAASLRHAVPFIYSLDQTPSKLPPCTAWFTWTLWALGIVDRGATDDGVSR